MKRLITYKNSEEDSTVESTYLMEMSVNKKVKIYIN